jgi:hypothetical protein
MMRFDTYSDLPYILIFMPLMLAQVVSLLFICFILPALIEDELDSKSIRWVVVVLSYYIAFWIAEIIFIATV